MHRKFFKKVGTAALSAAMVLNCAVISSSVVAENEPTRYEFEDGVITGTGSVKTDSSASGGSYFYLESNSDSVAVTVNVPETGMYSVKICYNAAFGEKIQNLYVNGVDQGQISFTSEDWDIIDCGTVKLNKGENEIMIKSSWGWTNFDYLTVEPAVLSEIKATQDFPCDPNAISESKSLMAYLSSVYGKNIISGQQEIYSGGPHGLETEFEYLNDLTGHYPAIRGFDYGNFCCPAYGSDDGTTQRIIDWVKNKGGIATSSFHLNVPTEFASYTIGTRIDWAQTTYSEKTDFSPSKAATEGTKENEYYLQSLELLAKEFKKLEAEGIPVLWRPLHEAEGSGGEEGSWFWWGREGSAAYKKLWIYTYETMTEKFDCHNLIWEWNSYNYESSANWYPGDAYVDIIGYDKYNCTVYLAENDWKPSLEHNDSAISSTFYGIMDKYDGTKMIAMAENDCFSTVENLTSEKAGWLYFCTWYDGGRDDINFLSNPIFNTREDTIAMYQSDYCITLDELPENLYTMDAPEHDPITTPVQTTTITTTADPSIPTTTTTTAFKFEQKKYTVTLPTDSRTTMNVEIEGAPKASIGGGLGFGTTAADWKNIEWSGNADADGKLTVAIDISEIPASITSAELQIWWSNVWDSAAEVGIDQDCEMVNYTFNDDAPVIYGDANCDGKVSIADAVLVMQAVANKDEYGVGGTNEHAITPEGAVNADCYTPGSDLTSSDALSIQRHLVGLITLPEWAPPVAQDK